MQDIPAHTRALSKLLRDELGIGKGLGKIDGKVCISVVIEYTSCLEYISKDVFKPHFRHMGTTGITRDNWIAHKASYDARTLGSFGLSGKLWKRHELFNNCCVEYDQYGNKLLDLTVWDILKRTIYSGDGKLSPSWVTGTNSNGVLDVEQVNIFEPPVS
jgi:hypothetical protein